MWHITIGFPPSSRVNNWTFFNFLKCTSLIVFNVHGMMHLRDKRNISCIFHDSCFKLALGTWQKLHNVIIFQKSFSLLLFLNWTLFILYWSLVGTGVSAGGGGGLWYRRKSECPEETHVSKHFTLSLSLSHTATVVHGDLTRVAEVRSECVIYYATLTPPLLLHIERETGVINM